jgi:hypothetical protein
MTPSFRVSQYRVVGVTLVEEAASFFCTLEDESVDSSEGANLGFWRGVVPNSIADVRTTHWPRERINRSSSSLWNLTARPGPAGLRRPSRTALQRVTELKFVYCAALSYVR